jgi:hypothetical protein
MSDLELKWRPIDLTADRPLARGGHASAVVTHGGTPHLYIIGGADPFGAVTGAVTVVNLDSSAAHPAVVAHGSDRMSPRCSHSCVAVTSSVDGGEGPHILVYGGVAYDPVQTVFDDMWGITIDKADPLTITWTRLTATGDAPGRRHSFASACLESRWIIACGVTGDEPTGPECTGYTNAVHQLNIATREWTRVQVDIGPEREMAAAASAGRARRKFCCPEAAPSTSRRRSRSHCCIRAFYESSSARRGRPSPSSRKMWHCALLRIP